MESIPPWDDEEWMRDLKQAGLALHLWMAINALMLAGLAVVARLVWRKVRR
jgi:hypothetical protein